MDQQELIQLIDQLQQLQIQRESISAEEQRILQRIRRSADSGDNNDNGSELPTRAAVVTSDVVSSAVATTPPTFSIGQHVYITNNINHTVVRRATNADRASVVTHFTNTGRIAIRTYNGFRTNRVAANLRVLTDEEQIAYSAERRR